MSDNRNYSVITNFGCHWQCPYCIVRNTGIQIAETRMGATYDTPDEEVYDFYDGMTTAYEHVINYCRHLLGYSGTMPSEVPNQSEDAKE